MWLRRAVALTAVLALSGCAVTDHFDDRVDRFDTAAEQARDQVILLNIVRASHAEPVAFLNLGQIQGNTQTSGVLGLPGFVLGPFSPVAASAAIQKSFIFGASGAGGQGFIGNQTSIQGSTNITTSPAETKDFYTGLLTPVQPVTLQFFIEQGISREVLFYLFTSAVIENGRQVTNDPLNPTLFPEFQNVVHLSIDYGLSTEEIATDARGARKQADGAKAPERQIQLCFNTHAIKKGTPPQRLSPICGSGEVSKDPRTVIFGNLRVTVVPRSVFGIFQFLGGLLASRQPVMLHSAEAIGEPPLQDPYLFDVKEGFAAPCFLSINYEGNQYCVPLSGAENTKRIISILTQLLALNTTIQEIPITPLVQAAP